LVGLEDQQLQSLNAMQDEEIYKLRGSNRRLGSGHPDNRRLSGLENIYLSKY